MSSMIYPNSGSEFSDDWFAVRIDTTWKFSWYWHEDKKKILADARDAIERKRNEIVSLAAQIGDLERGVKYLETRVSCRCGYVIAECECHET